jgi:hypothetical protein
MGKLGYTIVASKPEGRQWVRVQSVEEAIETADRLGWVPEEVELHDVDGREDEPTYTLWRDESGRLFAEVLLEHRSG